MDFILNYILCGVVVGVVFEVFRKHYSPDTNTTPFDGILGVIIFPLIILIFIIAFIYYYFNLRNK